MRILIFIICLFLTACKLESKNISQTIEALISSPRVSIDTESLEDITATNIAHFVVSGNCSEEDQPITVVVGEKDNESERPPVTVRARRFSPATAPTCTNGTWTTALDLTELRKASRTVLITADHSRKSTSLTAPQARENVLLYPTLSIDIESLENITATNIAHFMVSGNCSEEDQPITVVVSKKEGGVNPTTAPNCTNGAWTTAFDLTELEGVLKTVLITANHWTKSKGLAAPQARGNVLLYPTLSIDIESLENITATNAASFRISGRCSEEGQPITVIVDENEIVDESERPSLTPRVRRVSPTTAPTCTNGTWTTALDLTKLDGAARTVLITADHSTSDGLILPQVMERILLYPRVSIDVGEGITAANITHFVVSGSCSEEGQPVTVRVGGVSPMTAPNCTNGVWTTAIDLTRLSGVSRTVLMTADHWTANGLATPQAIENVPLHPSVSINIGSLEDIMATNAASFRISGSCSEEGRPITVVVGKEESEGEASPTTDPICTNGAWATEVNISHLSGISRPVLMTADHATSEGLAASQAIESVIAYLSFSIDTDVLENITPTNAANFRVSGSCLSEGQPITVTVGEGEKVVHPATDPICTHGAWEVHLDVTGLNKMAGDVEITVDHWSPLGDVFPQDTATVTNHFVCPQNYVGVPELSGYTTKSFCVMKYEAKNNGSNNAISQPSGTPYTRINRNQSIDKCTRIGNEYDLITNDEWQSLARNIELVSDNWATGVVGTTSGLSRGHSDSLPNNTLDASSDDTEGCYKTEQICDGNTWNAQRRTHTLSNGEVIWDVSGNVAEWVKDTNTVNYGANALMSQTTTTSHPTLGRLTGGTTNTLRVAKDQFGSSGDYSNLNSFPYGGLGFGWLNANAGGVLRGGQRRGGGTPGVFAVYLNTSITNMNTNWGFRCTYTQRPSNL